MRKKDRQPKTKVFIQPAMSFGKADMFKKIPEKLQPRMTPKLHGLVQKIGAGILQNMGGIETQGEFKYQEWQPTDIKYSRVMRGNRNRQLTQ